MRLDPTLAVILLTNEVWILDRANSLSASSKPEFRTLEIKPNK